MRVLVECTYVYEHPQDNSGIQRVVRNVIKNLSYLNLDAECVPVILRDGKVYEVKSLAPLPDNSWRSQLPKFSLKVRALLAVRSNWIKNKVAALVQRVPFSNSWLVRKAHSAFNRFMSMGTIFSKKTLTAIQNIGPERSVEFTCQSGDVLLLLDSSWHADFFPLAEQLQRDGVKIVSVIYDLIPLTHPQFCDEGLVRVFDNWFNWVAKTADGFFAISKTIIDQVEAEVRLRLGDESADRRWFDYFHLGSDLDLISSDYEVRSSVTQMCKKHAVYLMVSTIEPRKNHAYLLDAFEHVWSQGSDVALCFVGKIGWKTEALINRVRTSPHFNKRLFMFNDLNDSELEYCYKYSRSLVFPSYVEGFGLPLVEAMQRGLPALASDIPVFREIGGPSMGYFELSDPNSLASLVKQFEDTNQFPAEAPLSKWSWISWKDSAQQLLSRVYGRVVQHNSTQSAIN